ncbi:MAG: cytosine deaminase [Nodosilinea sp.]
MSDSPFDLILRQCLLPGNPDLVDIAIEKGKIVAMGTHLANLGEQELLVQGRLTSPPFVESHIHLDSVLTVGQPRWNSSGTLFEGIDIWRDRKATLSYADVKARAVTALRLQAEQGVLFVRTHADVSEPSLVALQALLDLRESVQEWMTLQVVAFPQDGIYGSPQNATLLEEALKLGADAVGGIPHYEFTREDGVRSIEQIFQLAQTYDRLVDIHCDEIDDDQSRFLEVVAACALRSDLGSRVTASHTTAFASYNNAYAFKLMGLLERAQINFVANPLINITLQGRTDTYPKRRGITRVKELWQRGLNVSLGHDCIQDPWYSLGTGNMLNVAAMAIHGCQMTGQAEIDACYAMVTENGARTLNLGNQYGIEVGKPANLIVMEAENPYDALRRTATVTHVISRGKLLAQTQPAQTSWFG